MRQYSASFVRPWNVNENILDLDSDDRGSTLPLPLGLSIDVVRPNLDTTSDAMHVCNSAGASNDVLALNLDTDSFVFARLGIPNPFDIGLAWGNIELADLDIGLGLNVLQQFGLLASGLTGTITCDDGSSPPSSSATTSC